MNKSIAKLLRLIGIALCFSFAYSPVLNAQEDDALLAGSRFDEETMPIIRSMPMIKSVQTDSESEDKAFSSDICSPDKNGRRSDTYYFLGYQAASIAILYALPEGVTGWTQEQKDQYSMSKWWYNVRHPQWDSDDFYINYILHPYWGATYYVRSRERGFDQRSSFWYSAGMSAAYEFGAEALFEEVSIQDLIVTPVGGWLLGEYFMGVRNRIEARHDSSTKMPFQDRLVLTLTDPLGGMNRVVDGWFGRGEDLIVVPYRHPSSRSFGPGYISMGSSDKVYGLTIEYRW
jgi:hypothetical protein